MSRRIGIAFVAVVAALVGGGVRGHAAPPAPAPTVPGTGGGGGFTGQTVFDSSFLDSQHGWVAGGDRSDTPLLLKTSNAGQDWTAVQLPSGTPSLLSVVFLNSNDGWISGWSNNAGAVVLGTTDAGATWSSEPLPNGGGSAVYSLDFLDAQTGWALQSGGTLLATNDGGASWTASSLPQSNQFWGATVRFTDAQHGWIAGCIVELCPNQGHPAILSTSDGGASWTETDFNNEYGELTAIQFIDNQHAWAVGTPAYNDRPLLATTSDGGVSWTFPRVAGTSSLRDVSFDSATDGWAVGSGAEVLHTTDAGTTWSQVGTLPRDMGDLMSVKAFSPTDVIATGRSACFDSTAAIVATSDGATWSDQLAPPSPAGVGALYAIAMHSSDGAVGGSDTCGGDVAGASADAGQSWSASSTPGSPLGSVRAMALPDALHGWAADGRLLESNDRGANWAPVAGAPNGTTVTWSDVSFPDTLHGWVSGGHPDGSSALASTSDGGASWQNLTFPSNVYVSSIDFADSTHGWAIGDHPDGSGNYPPLVLVTTDAGTTWTQQTLPSAVSDVLAVSFVGISDGWIGADSLASDGSGATPVMLHTTDGGATWTTQTLPSASGVDEVSSLSFADASHGWATTDTNQLFHTTDGGAAWTVVAPSQSAQGFRDVAAGSITDVCTAGLTAPVNASGTAGIITCSNDGGATWTDAVVGNFSPPATNAPDVPLGVLLPLAGVAAAGVFALGRRRSRVALL
ncbi:MAG: WD40/YVTN/BNR-like repeat-containing protein [Candidatus Dormibacteria bacterium]